MSGGSYNYAYSHVRNMADEIQLRSTRSALRDAFAAHLRLVADAMHDLEWVDSSDYVEGDADEAMRKCLRIGEPVPFAIDLLIAAMENLQREIAVATAHKVEGAKKDFEGEKPRSDAGNAGGGVEAG